jgi:hypothetical protein
MISGAEKANINSQYSIRSQNWAAEAFGQREDNSYRERNPEETEGDTTP